MEASHEHGCKSSASCVTGGEHAAGSVPRRFARGASLVEASGDDGNRRVKMAWVANLCDAPTTSTTMSFKREIRNDKIRR
jgi:hypothetical protein